MRHDIVELVPFRNAPFPYDGAVPDDGLAFLQVDETGQRFHDSPRGGRLYETSTYSDRRSLICVPRGFDPMRADACLVLFFHGNQATLARDVIARQGVPRQVLASHLNAVLVAPQMAVDALDSSAGRFWQPGFLEAYLAEAAAHIAARTRLRPETLEGLPVVLVAYSGGYLPAAFSLAYAGSQSRIRAVILLDALFGEATKFRGWIERRGTSGIFVDAYSASSAPLSQALRTDLVADGIAVQETLPTRLAPGDVVFLPSLDAVHNDIVTRAFAPDPLALLLRRLRIA